MALSVPPGWSGEVWCKTALDKAMDALHWAVTAVLQVFFPDLPGCFSFWEDPCLWASQPVLHPLWNCPTVLKCSEDPYPFARTEVKVPSSSIWLLHGECMWGGGILSIDLGSTISWAGPTFLEKDFRWKPQYPGRKKQEPWQSGPVGSADVCHHNPHSSFYLHIVLSFLLYFNCCKTFG